MSTKHHSYKRYDDEFKRNAVELLERKFSAVSADSIVRAKQELGVPRGSPT
jgi:hypothetical protein